MCEFSAGCKQKAEFTVINKAVGLRSEFKLDACHCCASKIGRRAKGGALINTESMDSQFYRLEKK